MPESPAGRDPRLPDEESFAPATRDHDPGELETKPFLDHLTDLRSTLLKIVGVFLILAVASFVAIKPLATWLRMPLDRLEERKGMERGEIELTTLGPQKGFTALMSIAFGAAVGLSLPFTLWFIAQFVRPGLTRRERHAVAPALAAGVLLFVAGVLFAFFVTSPLLLNFLWSLFETLGWENTWTVNYYYGFLTQFLLVSGLTFELPLVLTVLVRLEVLTIAQLSRFRRHAIIAILVVSAMFTPPDAASMFMVAGPMYLLYEASIVVSVFLGRRRARRAGL
jgi:sec-independent protein translocase protein TatC